MSCGREDLHQLNNTKYLGANDLSKGMIKIPESLIHALMRVYSLGTFLEVKDTHVTTKGQRGLRIALMW